MDKKFVVEIIIAFSIGTFLGLVIGIPIFGTDILVISIMGAFIHIYLFSILILLIAKDASKNR